MSNTTVMTQYFGLLNEIVDRLELRDKPHRIFNADETGWSGKEKSHQKVYGIKGQHTYQQSVTACSHITAHICIGADGRVLPTFLIFEKALPHMPYKDRVPGQWLFGSSESGYMDTELFTLWFKNIFLKHCGQERPVLLVMDNHDSHINIEIIKLARENNIELLGLPAHTTHILQPLDVSINGPLKQKFSALANNLGFVNKNLVLNKAKFPVVLSHAIDQVCSPAKIKGAFRKSGLYPIDQDAIDVSQLTPTFIKASQVPPPAPSQSTTATSHHQPSTSSMSAPSSSQILTSKPSTSAASQMTQSANTTCSQCGSFLGENPLVKEGLIPESLAQLFPPVPAKPQGASSRKLVTEARVITTEDFYKKLCAKQKETLERKEEIEKRKVDRMERKKEKKEEKEQKQKMKASKKEKKEKLKKRVEIVEVSEAVVDLGVCCECDSMYPDGECENVEWIACDQCERWYHQLRNPETFEVMRLDSTVYEKTVVVQPEDIYMFKVYAVNEDNQQGYVTSKIKMAPAGVPKNDFEDVENKKVIPINKVVILGQTSFRMVIKRPYLEQTTYGAIVLSGIIICTDCTSLTGKDSISLNAFKTYPNYNDATDNGGPYRPVKDSWVTDQASIIGRRKTTTDDEIEYTVGEDVCTNTVDFCNGPLKPDTPYSVQVVVCTNGGCLLSNLYGPFKTEAETSTAEISSTIIIISVMGAVILVLVVAFVISFVHHRIVTGKQNGLKTFSQILPLAQKMM